MVNEQLSDAIRPIIGKEVVKCDCSEPKSIAELKRSGITATPCKKGKDSVLHGIQWLQGKEIIVDKNQQEMINELSIAQWDKDKNGNVLPRPIDRDNHLIDALRYSYDSEMNYSGVKYGTLPF
jgi:phage terminase large subunit